MSRPIRYRRSFGRPAADVYAATVVEAHLLARLAALSGGREAKLLSYEKSATGARFRILQGLDPADLPAVARMVLPGEVSIERSEVWRVESPDRYSAEVHVRLPGVPGTINGSSTLAGTGPDRCEWIVDGEVTVQLPLIGGKIEEIVAAQVVELLAAETAYTDSWLASTQG
jgi:Protein of unknown function (DUF2505)